MSSITVNEATLNKLLQKTVKLTISNGSSFIGNIIEVHDTFCVLDNVYRETTSAALEIIPRPVKFNYDLITEMSLIDALASVVPEQQTPPNAGNMNAANDGASTSSRKHLTFSIVNNRAEKDTVDETVEDCNDDLFGELDLDAERERYKKQIAQRNFIITGARPDDGSAPLSYDSSKSFFDTLTVRKGNRRNNNGNNRYHDNRHNDGDNGNFSRKYDNRSEGDGHYNNYNSRRRNDQNKTSGNGGGYRHRDRNYGSNNGSGSNRQQGSSRADMDYRPRNTGNRSSGRLNNIT